LDYATLLSFFATPILTLDQRLKRHARLSGAIGVLSLMVFNWNTGALLFYQRVGFRLDGDYHIVDADALLGVPSKDGSATLA
jgi:hypothetical protein